ncbi:hypothetical protein NADFUDRAFT_50392 [Nadsonia fulvescens var. elongata DSM 6958]|uniref:Histone-lysine N-methyltransferase SET5 n=1 Tax=Nadsonia fulvescens var. elongata DSM 6958 TaxID=857566 RepID=A0A1E3PNF1_9ASCO|nr:hypothetical protein NADFUDRAFT_50392 [Nadsonia fulvescens var. elongata DSM 6958]
MTVKELESGIFRLDVDDSVELPAEVPRVPYEREIVQAVIDLWKSDPSTESLGIPKLHALIKELNPSWQVSPNRIKTLLKSHGLSNTQQHFQYVSQITSFPREDLTLPPGVGLKVTKNKGKCLYAIKSFKEGQEIWSEEPMFLIAPIDHISLMRTNLACVKCSRPFQSRLKGSSISTIASVTCSACSGRWCSPKCKKSDTIHAGLYHKSMNSKSISKDSWLKFEQYCLNNQWQAAYSLGIITANIKRDPSGELQKSFDSMARVRQDVRQKAVEAPGASSVFGGSLTENMWQEGYRLLLAAFPGHELSYDEFMFQLGAVNINNLDHCLFLIQSHLNHSCDPNVSVKILSRNGGIKVTAKRDIKAGEEFFTSYVNPKHELSERKYELRINWGFLCGCTRCKKEEKETKDAIEAGIPVMTTERSRRKSVRFDEGKPTIQK